MRIAQLHTRYRQQGGEDVVVEAQRQALRTEGHPVREILADNPSGPVAAGAAFALSAWNPFAAARVAKEIERFRPDVAHVHNTWFAMSPSVIWTLHRQRIPVVMTLHNYRLACANSLFLRDGVPCTSCVDDSPAAAVKHRCYHSRTQSAVAASGIALHRRIGTWSSQVDRFIVLSEFARNQVQRIGVPESRIEVGRNFVPDPGPRPRGPEHSRDVLFIGRISREKGLHVLLEAWAAAAPQGLRLVVIGDGPQRAELERHAGASVVFTGRQNAEAVQAALLTARALVVPSLWFEGQPLVALEGLAAGTPLVLSDIGALPEVIGDGSAGWLFSPGSVDALADRLRALSDDGAVAGRGECARRDYLQRFTQKHVIDDLLAVFDRVAGGGH